MSLIIPPDKDLLFSYWKMHGNCETMEPQKQQ